MENISNNMAAALTAAGVIEAEAAPEGKVFDILTATPEDVKAEKARLEAEAEAAEDEAEAKKAEAAEKAEAAAVAKENFKKAEKPAEKAAAAVEYMTAEEKAEAAEKAAAAAEEKAEAAAARVAEFIEATADIMVIHRFLRAFTAKDTNAAAAAQVALAYCRPEKYLNNKAALQTDALSLCRKVLGDVVPEEVAGSGNFKDNLTVKGALTLCALLTEGAALTVKEARAKFKAR